MIESASQTCCSAVTTRDPLDSIHWISVVCRILGAYDRPEATDWYHPQAPFLWRLVLSLAAVTRETSLHHLFQKGRQPRPSYSPTGSVSSRKLANCILSRKPVKSDARHPIYQERMRQSFSYRPCYTRATPARTLQSETRAVSCHWCRGLHLEQLPRSIGHNRLCPQILPVRTWGMARALSLSHPPTLSRLR